MYVIVHAIKTHISSDLLLQDRWLKKVLHDDEEQKEESSDDLSEEESSEEKKEELNNDDRLGEREVIISM